MKHPFDKVLLTSTVNELSSKQKFWFASSIAGMVGADGHAHREELDFLKKAINFLDSEDQIHEIISMVKGLQKGFSPPLGKLTLEPRLAFFILKYLAKPFRKHPYFLIYLIRINLRIKKFIQNRIKG